MFSSSSPLPWCKRSGVLPGGIINGSQLDVAQQLWVGRGGEELPVSVVGRGGCVAEGNEGMTWPIRKPFDVQWLRTAVCWELYKLFDEEENGNVLLVTGEDLIVWKEQMCFRDLNRIQLYSG